MNTISAVIVEDEAPAARLLQNMIKRIRPEWDIEIRSGTMAQNIEWFATHRHPDILFLDIQLADGTSFDLISQVKPRSSIIFTTAYNEYAIRAFSVNSIDYLLKPVDDRRLAEAIARFETTNRNIPLPPDYLDSLIDTCRNKEKRYRTRFLIPLANKYITLNVNSIAYFTSEDSATVAITYQGYKHIIGISLTKLEEQLSPDQFFRINRRMLVCVDAIAKIEPYFNGRIALVLNPKTDEPITVSEDRIASFKMWLNY